MYKVLSTQSQAFGLSAATGFALTCCLCTKIGEVGIDSIISWTGVTIGAVELQPGQLRAAVPWALMRAKHADMRRRLTGALAAGERHGRAD